jgi:ribosomal protein L40E
MTGKQLPLQILRLLLNRAVDSAITDKTRARGLATTLEKYAARLRIAQGGKTLLGTVPNTTAKTPLKPASGQKKVTMLYCMTCGETTPSPADKCPHCGEEFE